MFFRLRWETKGLGGESVGDLSRRVYHWTNLKMRPVQDIQPGPEDTGTDTCPQANHEGGACDGVPEESWGPVSNTDDPQDVPTPTLATSASATPTSATANASLCVNVQNENGRTVSVETHEGSTVKDFKSRFLCGVLYYFYSIVLGTHSRWESTLHNFGIHFYCDIYVAMDQAEGWWRRTDGCCYIAERWRPNGQHCVCDRRPAGATSSASFGVALNGWCVYISNIMTFHTSYGYVLDDRSVHTSYEHVHLCTVFPYIV